MKVVEMRYYRTGARNRAWTGVLFAVLNAFKVRYYHDPGRQLIQISEKTFHNILPFIKFCPVDVVIKKL